MFTLFDAVNLNLLADPADITVNELCAVEFGAIML